VSAFEIRAGAQARLAFERERGRCLGGIGWNWYRPWLYPLYTPGGEAVLQEFPFDHPFHNACFVGQHPVRFPGGEANFWAAPPWRSPEDEIFVRVGRMETDPAIGEEAHAAGVRFTVRCVWRDEKGAPVLNEERRFCLALEEDAVICDVASRKVAAYCALEFPATKFGGIGVRVDPRLAPDYGAAVVAEGGRGGARLAHDRQSRFVAFESGGEPRFGLLLIGDDPALAWFVRDYGLAVWNPTRGRTVSLARGEAWQTALRLVAYDGSLDENRAARLGGAFRDGV